MSSTSDKRLYFKKSKITSASSLNTYSWSFRSLFPSSRNVENNLSCLSVSVTTTLPKKSILKITTQEESEHSIYGVKRTPFGSLRSVGSSIRSIPAVSSFKRNNKIEVVVCFRNIETREYATIVGEHPLCSSGVALSLDWDYVCDIPVTVDEYESLRRPRKKFKEMKLSDEEREDILLRQGATHEEIGRACESQQKARERRLNLLNVSNRKSKRSLFFCPLKVGFFSWSTSTPMF